MNHCFLTKLVAGLKYFHLQFILAIFLMYETLCSVRNQSFRFTVSKVVPISLLLFSLHQISSFLWSTRHFHRFSFLFVREHTTIWFVLTMYLPRHHLLIIQDTVLSSPIFFFSSYASEECSLRTLSPVNNITNSSRTKRPTISSSCSILPCYSREHPTTWRVLRNPHSRVGNSSRKLHQLDRSNPCTIAHCLGLYCPNRPSR